MPAPSSKRTLLEVRDLTVLRDERGELRPVVRGLNFDIAEQEVLGIQGRSGCGKTSTALALLKLLPTDVQVTGSVSFQRRDLLSLPERELRKIRGRNISIVYQEPGLALNPVMRVGDQIGEVLRSHFPYSSSERKNRVKQMLEKVRLSPARFYGAYPHELSGGERHRVVMAQALICGPSLVIADEPTVGLDAALKNEILELIVILRRDCGASFLIVSHDRDVINRVADRSIQLSLQSADQVISVKPSVCVPGPQPNNSGSSQNNTLLTVRNLNKWYEARGLFRRKHAEKRALDSVDLSIPAGTILGLIGESGSGKSTLARCLCLLENADSGEVIFGGKNLLDFKKRDLRRHRPLFQYIAQDSAEALNPRFTALEAVEEPLVIQDTCSSAKRRARAQQIMEQVGLDVAAASRSCHEFSGGQKQRLTIARALTLEPKLIVLDESLSGLDPETQREILELLFQLKQALGITQLLISHDLDLVSRIADTVAVMQDGRIVEHEMARHIAENPTQWSVDHALHAAPRQELVLAETE